MDAITDHTSMGVADVAYSRLRTDILGGELLPGMKLKLEALRDRYEVSVNTLRETLSRLAADGLVEAEGQRGFTVVPATLADLIDITETRRLLECHAARLSVEHADLEWESRLVAAYHKLSKAEEMVAREGDKHADQLERYNREFHIALISGCNSRWLLHFHRMMYDQSLRYRMLAFRVKDFPRDQSRREHKQILNAALARDAGTLVAVLGTHITKGAEMYAEHEAERSQPRQGAQMSLSTTPAAAATASAASQPAQPFLLGLIGSPIMSSAAPAMHEAAAQSLGLTAHYRLIDVAGADRARLKAMLEGVRLLGFSGVNVTFPYKEAIVSLLDALSSGAAAIGTANTVVVRDGKLTGHNTDATGFASAFEAVLGAPGDAPVVLIGAGGVGRAIGFALAELGARTLRILDREADKAQALAARLADRVTTQVCGNVAEALAGAGGVINGTPIGMLPNRDSPVAAELLHDGLWVADAVYTPLWTPLLQAARAKGCRVMTGRELCIHQAADAFRLFTGFEASRERIGAAFDAVIAKRSEPK